jgi:hypothetical protein
MLFSFLDVSLSFGSGNPQPEKEKSQEKTDKESSADDSGSFSRGDKIFLHHANLIVEKSVKFSTDQIFTPTKLAPTMRGL